MLTMLLGSDQASSVAVANSDTIYFTVNGDSRVFRLSLSTDSLAVVHDFGAGTIARDIQVAGRRPVAVIGGAVSFTIDSVIGTFQRDGGGTLVQVDLDSGVEVPRRDTGQPGLTDATLQGIAQQAYQDHPEGIPYESPRYRQWADLDSNGLVEGPGELLPLYLSAARDFAQPLFYFAAPRVLRLGVELTF